MTWRIWVMLVAISAAGAYGYGRMSQAQADKLSQLEGFHEAVLARDALTVKVTEADRKLQELQASDAEVKRVEVVKWRTKYVEKIADAATAKCIDDSGLREEYNASFPTSDDTK